MGFYTEGGVGSRNISITAACMVGRSRQGANGNEQTGSDTCVINLGTFPLHLLPNNNAKWPNSVLTEKVNHLGKCFYPSLGNVVSSF